MPLEKELEFEFASCIGLVIVDCTIGLGIDDLERGFGFGFIEFTMGIAAEGWLCDSRPVSSTESGDIGIFDADFEKVVS